MNQTANNALIKKILIANFQDDVRFIKIHGSKYQESGLPDILCAIKRTRKTINIWLEVKRNWKDKPTPLQIYNIKDLRNRNFFTGFVAGKEFKLNWNDEPVLFEMALKGF